MNIVVFYSERSWDEVVNNRLFREIGKRNFYLRFNSWFILSFGKVYFVVIEMNKNEKVLVNVIMIFIIVLKILFFLVMLKSLGINMYGIERF